MGFCTKCGAEIQEGAAFCTKCGASVDINNTVQDISNNQNEIILNNLIKPMGPWLGIISLVLALLGYIAINNWIDLLILNASIVIAIVCIFKKTRWKGFPIASIVLVLILFTLYSYNSIASVKNSGLSSLNQLFETEKSANVDPELKAFLDSYEDFVDDYVAFMEKYYDNPEDLSLLSNYTEFLQDYSDFYSKLSKYDTSKMSTEDYNYYIEVTARCSQKLINALGSE